MTIRLFRKVILGLAMMGFQFPICNAQDSETTLNLN
jgi:hypothetical protein